MFCVTSAKLKQSCEIVSTSAITDHRISAAHLWTLSSVYPPEFPTQSCWAQTDSPVTHHHYDVTNMMSPSLSSVVIIVFTVLILCVMKKCVIVCVDAAVHSRCFLCCETNCFLTVCVCESSCCWSLEISECLPGWGTVNQSVCRCFTLPVLLWSISIRPQNTNVKPRISFL